MQVIEWKYVDKELPSAHMEKCLVAIDKEFAYSRNIQVDVACWHYSTYHGKRVFMNTDETQWVWEYDDVYAWAEWPNPPELK